MRHRRRNAYSSYYGSRGGSRGPADWLGLLALVCMLVCSVILLVRVLDAGVLTTVLTVVFILVLVLLNGLHAFVQLPVRRNVAGKLICSVVALALSAAMIFTSTAAGSFMKFLSNITSGGSSKTTVSVVVRADDKAETVNDTFGYTYGILEAMDRENTDALLSHIEDGLGQVQTETFGTLPQLADALLTKQVDAIILNGSYFSVLKGTEGYQNFSKDTKVIYRFSIDNPDVEPIAPNANISREPFVVYCSGTDERVDYIPLNSRSDTNILAVVNPSTHQILLVSTPRDYYLTLPSKGQKDKLTHFGLYGIEESIKGLEQLYNVDVDYYARVHFAGLVGVIDALGGIDVNSDVAFNTVGMEVPDEDGSGNFHFAAYSFQQGVNHLDGRQALAFARERDAFDDGDMQRGRNQMLVIQGIVNKAASPAILKSYQDVLSAASDSIATNMPKEDIISLVKMQLQDMSGWNITTYGLAGENSADYCYSLGNDTRYAVVLPNERMVATAQDLIQQVLRGETPTVKP